MIKNQRVFWSGQYLFPDTDDPGDEPDVGLLEGTVTFAPVWDAGVSGLLSDSQRSTYVKPFPIEIRDGQLMSNDDGTWIPGVKIPASIGGHPLSWVARFDLSAGSEKVTVRELRFTSNPDGEVHLHNVIPAEAIFPQLPPDIVKGDSVTNIYTQGQYVVFIVGDPPRTKQYVLAFPGTDEAIAAAEAAVVEFEQLRDAGVLAINETRTSAEAAIGQARDEVQGLKDDATTQAGIATTKAGEAGGFRNEAEGFKNAASTQAGIATTKAGESSTHANRAEAAANEFDLTATSSTLAPGAAATVTVSGDGPAYSLAFGVPQGPKGDKGLQGGQEVAWTDDGRPYLLDVAVAEQGDSGWRDLSALLSTNVSAGRLLMRRHGDVVTVVTEGVGVVARGFICSGSWPAGFRPRQPHAVTFSVQGPGMGENPTVMTVHSSGGNATIFSHSNTDWRRGYGEVSFVTPDAWPSTLPGTAV